MPLGYNRTFVTDRDSQIATVPIGYGDGISRHLSNVGSVLIHGALVPIVGAISMDSLLVDITDLKDAHANDEVVLIGRQNGSEIKANDIALWARTVPHDVLSGLRTRIPRIHLNEN